MLEAGGAATDQAAGLRRLFRPRAALAVAFVSGREACGRTTLLVRTAAALAEAGESVVIIDENQGADNAHAALGVRPRHDLLDFVDGRLELRRLAQPVADRLSLISASRFTARTQQLDVPTAERMNAGFRQLQEACSFVLVDCAAGQGQHLSPLALAAPRMAVVVAAQGSAITRGYALIKRLAQERARDGFQVAITRARDEQEALAIFHNMRRTAQQHLGVRLDFLGEARVPTVDHLAAALQGGLGQSSAGAQWFGFAPRPGRGSLAPADRTRLATVS